MDKYQPDESVENDPLEAYCVRCRVMVEIQNPEPVWTRRSMPATRGECPICQGTVFRMGPTSLHDEKNRPAAVTVADENKRKRPKLPQDTVYVLYAEADEIIAQQLAADLSNAGIATWLHEHHAADVKWAGRVHPALKECQRMVIVWSPAAQADAQLAKDWLFFREQRKPVILALMDGANPPDELRRSARFDFARDYKRAFREMMQALG